MSQTISCKMCGGSLMLRSGLRIAECEFCGTLQTIPLIDDEKKLRKFERANRLRRNKEFDKASGIYESIVDDCPEEAEAYWGMVLCRFGIEYVDDPATGKKVPTCHRTSFTTVMEDEDCQQAMENSSGEARKLYRAEATQIEELRKKIIEVSSQTEPFDIFICYKETDDRGSRTVDSLLAQDIYDMLTREGYRVFFSRITLEDKLGSEYEPLIFSALNSSKIMLAVGTDYDHFDAVWVKNEWSRFLKLMTQDNTKTLIPCYKGITPNDFPAEFAKLQAQDLGKVGAMQDLLRGIEKILPKKTIQPPIPGGGKVVGGIEIQTLLERAQFALEDKNWSDALKFCEQILNKDARNGRAYLYKLLAGETCGSLGELVRKRLDATQHGRKEEALYPADEQYIQQAVEIYSIPNFTNEDEIRELYKTEIHYQTEVPSRVAQKNKEASFWTTNILLVRAENFADPALKKDIQTAKKAALAEMDKRIQLAREDEVATIAQAQAEYQKFLQEADLRTQEYHAKADAERARMYKEQKSQLFLMLNTKDLSDLAEMFQKLGDYKDSISYNLKCLNRIAKIEKIKRIIKIIRNVLLILLAGAIILGLIYSDKLVEMFAESQRERAEFQRQQAEFQRQYTQAQELLNAGDYEGAIVIFESLEDYSDSARQVEKAKTAMVEEMLKKYLDAQELLRHGSHYYAAIEFASLGDYQDAREKSFEIWQKLAPPEIVSAGDNYSVAVQKNGAVLHAGDYTYGQGLIDEKVVSISAGGLYTIALMPGGVASSIGLGNANQCNVQNWSDLVAVSSGDVHTVGLMMDGTITAVGDNAENQCDMAGWCDIIAISAGSKHTIGLTCAGYLLACGNNDYGQCDVYYWDNIIAVSAGADHTVALQENGTVLATGNNDYGQCNVNNWTDIVAIAAGESFTIGLKSDGTVVATGKNHYGQCNVFGWTDIVAIAAGRYHTVAVKRDGTAVAVGDNTHGQCDVSNWVNIAIPD